MAGGTLFIKVLPEKGAEAAIKGAVERGGQQAEGTAKDSGSRWGLGFATAAGVAIGRGLQTAMQLEQVEVSLTTLLGSGQAARDMLGDLTDFAARTPFEMKGLAQNARSLLGVGVAAEDVIPTLQTLGDASGALGLNQEQMDRVLRAVTQSMAKGKFQAEEMLQIAEAGIPIYGLMAQAVGKSVPEMQAMAAEGELLADDVLPALLAVMNEEYAGGMIAQSRTLSGILSTLKDDIDLGLAEAVERLIPLLKDFLPSAGRAAVAAIEVFGTGLGVVTTLASPLLDVLALLLEGFAALPQPIRVALTAALLLGRVFGGVGLAGAVIGLTKSLWAARGAMAAAATTAGTLGSRIGGVGIAAGRAAGAAGVRGLLGSLVGGKWGAAALGVGVLVTVIQNIADNADEAKARVDALVGEVDFGRSGATVDAIEKLNAVIAENRDAIAKDDLFLSFMSDRDEVIDASIDKIEELREAQLRYGKNSVDVARSIGLTRYELERLAEAEGIDLNLLAGDKDDVEEFLRLLRESNAAVEAGWDPTTALGEAMAVYADEASTAAEKSDALLQALEALTGDVPAWNEAIANLGESLRDFTDSFYMENAEGDTILNRFMLQAVDAKGQFDAATKAGGLVHDAMQEVRGAYLDVAQAAYDKAVAEGEGAVAAERAGKAAQNARIDFIAQAMQLGFTREQARSLADQYGLIPGDVVTSIATPGMTAAQFNTEQLDQQLADLPPNTPVRVTSLTEEAMDRLESLGFRVRTLPDGTIEVTAPNATAVGNLIDDVANRRRTATIAVTYALPRGGAPIQFGSGLADGGVIEMYAGGGMHGGMRRLTPMRAGWAAEVHANTWRIIGDRARGREWYIPEDAPNSLALLADAAAAHGKVLVQAMADGGLLGGHPMSLPVAGGRVTNIENNLYAAPSLPTTDQLARMQRRAEVLAGA